MIQSGVNLPTLWWAQKQIVCDSCKGRGGVVGGGSGVSGRKEEEEAGSQARSHPSL